MDDVVVVGAGVIGLSCAMRLHQAGARVSVVSPGRPERTTSWIAAAVWYPTRTAADPRVLGWAGQTYAELTRQAGRGVPGVVLRRTRMLRRGSTATPWWAAPVPDFRTVPAAHPYTGEWQFTVPAVEMGPYLDWLLQEFTAAGGVLLPRRLGRLSEAAGLAPVVVNATGLTAGTLAADPAVHPIRGRIVVVANPGLDTSIRDEDHPEGTTYIHPRSRDVVLGGTFEPGEDDLSPDRVAEDAIVARCTALVPELARASVLARRAGLRPGRTGGIRLERDPSSPGLIHTYGHAGAGVTLAWGCADAVTALALGTGAPSTGG